MAILLDAPRWAAHGTTWAHLVSDVSLAELHAFAERAHVPRRAFDLDHYDVPAERHDELVALGARSVSARVMVERLTASGLRVTARERARARRDDLAQRWRVLVPGAEAIGGDLLGRWSQPHRAYHGLEHLAACLRSVEVAGEAHGEVPRTVLLALWFHDAVHDGEALEDERRSADLARTLLGPLVAQDRAALTSVDVEEVVRLVLVTAHHDPEPGDLPGALVSDADLAVLAGSPEKYARYVRQVRREYAHVTDEAWRVGRADVLRSLLALERLFSTPFGTRRWEAPARANLAGELASLT
ncbi:DUF4031 domain-containing protein [Sanguibacter sp. A247]|uniref:DUF4031 domain-containing protein n=1 Tax=unclassified Sanguibacter TaxID=2645534 RepID=UPI003FD72CFA